MALNDVRFDVQLGGLGRVAEGKDHVSAMLLDGAAPAAFNGETVKLYLDIESAETDGIEATGTYAEAHYHISEFFRVRGVGSLYVGFGADFDDLEQYSDIRQVATTIDTVGEIAGLQTAAENAEAGHRPFSVLGAIAGDAAFDISAATDLATLTAAKVSVLVAGDGAGKGAALAVALGYNYMPALGAVLGAIALANVHESVAWPERFNLSDNSENDVIALAGGTNAPSVAQITQLHDKRYLTMQKHVGLAGTYLTDSRTAVIETSDFANIESNRTIDKAKRLVRAQLLPKLSSPLYVDGDSGKLSNGTVKYFETLAERALVPMTTGGEVSDIGVFINPAQDVLTTGILNITVQIVPVGVARNITVQIGYVVKTTT